MGLMLGAALAFAWASPLADPVCVGLARVCAGPPRGGSGDGRRALLWLLREDSPVTYRGGLVLGCVATVVLVAALLPVRSATEPPRRATRIPTWSRSRGGAP